MIKLTATASIADWLLTPFLLSVFAADGHSQEGRAHGVHAESADDSQCDAETSDSLAADGGATCLNPKTVAATFSSSTISVTRSRLGQDRGR